VNALDKPVDRLWTRPRRPWMTGRLSHGPSPAHANLCASGDDGPETKPCLTWEDAQFSTIHRPYHYEYEEHIDHLTGEGKRVPT